MTKTEQLAERCADKKAMHEAGYYASHIAIKEAYINGAQDMLERACELLRRYNTGVRGEEFINEFRKAMEE